MGGLRRRSAVIVTFILLAGVVASPAQAVAEPAKVRAIVTFHEPPGAAAHRALTAAGATVRHTYDIVPGVAIEVPGQALAGLRRNPLVDTVELDHALVAFDHTGNTGDLEYENAWGVEHIGAPAVHAEGVRGDGVRVGVIDTGIDYVHDDPDDVPYVVDPEFLGNYAGGWNFLTNDEDAMDDMGHGTHVAGILAAEKNGYLVSGVAPDVDLYGLKILDANGNGEYSALIAALDWAVDNDLDIVNMSLGGREVSTILADAVAAADAAGVLLVAASGNVNPLIWQELLFGCAVAFPAAYPQVLSTTFTNGNDALTGYSCTGPQVDFASPGDNIYSPVPIGPCALCQPYGYAPMSGTSMASPHLAGTAALLLSAGLPDLGEPGYRDDVRARLCATADPGFGVNSTPIPTTDPRYPNYFGCGVIDAREAVLGPTPTPTPTPTAFADAHAIAIANANAHPEPDAHAATVADPHADAGSHPDADTRSDTHADADALGGHARR